MKPIINGLGVAILLAGVAQAQNWDIGGSVAVELKAFPEDPAFPGQLEDLQPSLTVEGDVLWTSEDRSWRAVLIPFARIDGEDDQRTHVDLREAFIQWSGDSIEVRAGLAKVFWGTVESRRLVDIINQADSVEDIDEEDRLGQPMIEVTAIRDWGVISLFALPGFRERTFPGPEGRFRFNPPVVERDAPFRSSFSAERLDVAARYFNTFGAWDVGLAAFHGTSREPTFASIPTADGPRLDPIYDVITQVSADIQFTQDAWLWKFEGIVREGQGDTFAAAVGGFEYTFFGVSQAGADLGVLVEYQFDDRDEFAPPTPADNDLFFGARYALNDVQDTSVLAGGAVDLEDGSASAIIEAQRRLGQNWTFEFEARLFLTADDDNLLSAFVDDDALTLRLTRFF